MNMEFAKKTAARTVWYGIFSPENTCLEQLQLAAL